MLLTLVIADGLIRHPIFFTDRTFFGPGFYNYILRQVGGCYNCNTMAQHITKHNRASRGFMAAVAAAVIFFSVSLMSGCDPLMWGTSIDADSNGGVGIGVNLTGPYGGGALSWPVYSPGLSYPPYYGNPFFGNVPPIRPVPPLRPAPVVPPQRPNRPLLPGFDQGGIGLRPSPLPGGGNGGAVRPPVNNNRPANGQTPAVAPGQFRPGANVKK